MRITDISTLCLDLGIYFSASKTNYAPALSEKDIEFVKRQNAKVFITFLILGWISESLALTDNPFRHLNDAALTNGTASEFTFAVLGDFRTSRRDRPYAPVFNQMLYEITTIAPSFVISTGDAYYGYGGFMPGFKNEVDYFFSKIKPLDIPFFSVVGNHDAKSGRSRTPNPA